MNKRNLLSRAKEIATMAHSGQLDLAGKPYIGHLERVASMVQGSDRQIVAWLHDVMEDRPDLIPLVKAEFPSYIITALEAITHHTHEPYEHYIQRVNGNLLSVAVKIADLIDNTDLSRLPTVTDKDLARQAKYHKALRFLLREYIH